MSVAVPSRRKFARLSFADGEVMVSPRDQDIFFINADKATEACRTAVQQDERFKQFMDEILTPLHEWCVRHAEQVKACYIPIPEGAIRVFVLTTTRRFDFEFGEAVAALELSLARAGWRVWVSQLPLSDDPPTTFFNPDGALEVYAQSGSAPDQG